MPTDELRIPFAQAIVKDVCGFLGNEMRQENWPCRDALLVVGELLEEMAPQSSGASAYVKRRIVSISRAVLSVLGISHYDDLFFDGVVQRVAPHVRAYAVLLRAEAHPRSLGDKILAAREVRLRNEAQALEEAPTEPLHAARARAIVRAVWQAHISVKQIGEHLPFSGQIAAEKYVAAILDKLPPDVPTRRLSLHYHTRALSMGILSRILPGGSPSDLTPAIFEAVRYHLDQHEALEEAPTEPPPAPVVVKHECPCCRLEISYNASADVWHCPNCSWSKRQLVEPPPGPKFKVGDWVVASKRQDDPAQRSIPSQVMGIYWSEQNEWCYSTHRENTRSVEEGCAKTVMSGGHESQLTLDPYRQAAAKMFSKPAAHVTPEERQAAKLKAFKDTYTPIPQEKFYHVRPDDELQLLSGPYTTRDFAKAK